MYGLLPPTHGVVHVQRDGGVAVYEPAELLLETPVVRLVYDLLLPPVPNRVSPASAEHAPQTLGLRKKVAPS